MAGRPQRRISSPSAYWPQVVGDDVDDEGDGDAVCDGDGEGEGESERDLLGDFDGRAEEGVEPDRAGDVAAARDGTVWTWADTWDEG